MVAVGIHIKFNILIQTTLPVRVIAEEMLRGLDGDGKTRW